jgi:hypothetical protein
MTTYEIQFNYSKRTRTLHIGIYLQISWSVRRLHPPLCAPFSCIKPCRSGRCPYIPSSCSFMPAVEALTVNMLKVQHVFIFHWFISCSNVLSTNSKTNKTCNSTLRQIRLNFSTKNNNTPDIRQFSFSTIFPPHANAILSRDVHLSAPIG